MALLGLVGSLLEGLGIGLLIPLLASLNSGDAITMGGRLEPLARFANQFAPATRVMAVSCAILALILLKNLVNYTYSAFVITVDGHASHRIRCALSERLLAIGYPFFLAEQPARLVNIIAAESWRASEAIRSLFSAIASTGSIIIFVALLLLVEWRLTLTVIVGVLLIRLVHQRMMAPLDKLSRRWSEANTRLADRILVGVLGMRLIRIFGQEAREQARFVAASDEVRRSMLAVDVRAARIPPVQEALYALLFVVLVLGAGLFHAGVSVPVLIAFLVLLQRMQPHLRALEMARASLAAAQGLVREVEWLLDPAGKPAPPTGTRPFDRLEREIRFVEVEFRYETRPEAPPALERASFSIEAGRATALLGASGSGKSTIVNLICRLLEPTAGAILVDGTPLAEIDPVAWRRRISIAGQDVDLIEGSIAENIAYGAPDIGFDEVVEAARLADADRFIRSLPDGYSTDVGSRGLSLSGGQRQRIGLARALARKPEILILDEATSAVDGLSEANIMALIRESGHRMTMIVVSHRASTLALCEAGVVIDAGRVVESGPLATLQAYREMREALAV